MDKDTTIVILIVVLFVTIAFIVFTQPATTDGKINTKITFLSNVTLHNGENEEFQITDANGDEVANQNIEILFDDGSGNIQTYNIITDDNGKGYLTISGENEGDYDITINHKGNDKYNGFHIIDYITVESGYVKPAKTTNANSTASTVLYNDVNSTSNSTSGQLYYDSKYKFYYDDNRILHGGQNIGFFKTK